MTLSSPKLPQGQAFIAAIKVKLAGKITEPEARDTEIVPSSNGCLKLSNTFLGNSGSSSRNKTPLWAYHKTKKLARTIADLDESELIKEEHIAEAVSLRMNDKMLNELA